MTLPTMARPSKLYTPGQKDLFPLSRSKVELFQQCRRCFYLNRRLGISRPPGFPFSLNSAVDSLLKREFNVHRENGTPHPLMTAARITGVVHLSTGRFSLHLFARRPPSSPTKLSRMIWPVTPMEIRIDKQRRFSDSRTASPC